MKTEVTRARISGESTGPAGWAAGMTVALPLGASGAPLWGTRETTVTVAECARVLSATDTGRLREICAFTERAPRSSRLPFSYQRLPVWARDLAGTVIGRARKRGMNKRFPRWPLDLSVDFIADAVGLPNPLSSGPAPVLLTHDLDTPEGLRNAVQLFAPLEADLGARSANYVVPCGWPLDHGLLRDLEDRGHEIGVHGFDHSNRTAFAAAREQAYRLDAGLAALSNYHVSGYRSPSLYRTRSLFGALAERYRYDSSIPTSGGLFPVPGNGCATARPFRVAPGGIVEMPLTLPRDGSLKFLGQDPAAILALWVKSAQAIALSGGIVSLLTHCEARFCGSPEMLRAYRSFVAFLAGDERFYFTTPTRLLDQIGMDATA
ncbi:MAG TPA: hypothetical protein VK425_02250 [Acidimicrobiales bacterium]|nr:hypothetical protein [Acidimicrobiales bacterium]